MGGCAPVELRGAELRVADLELDELGATHDRDGEIGTAAADLREVEHRSAELLKGSDQLVLVLVSAVTPHGATLRMLAGIAGAAGLGFDLRVQVAPQRGHL